MGHLGSAICPENGSGYCPCHFVIACCHIGTFCTCACHSMFTLQWPSSELRKGLDVNIASAMASEASDKTKILNSIRLPRAGTVFLEQTAPVAHESPLTESSHSPYSPRRVSGQL